MNSTPDEDAKKIGDAVLDARVPPSMVKATVGLFVVGGIVVIGGIAFAFLVVLMALFG